MQNVSPLAYRPPRRGSAVGICHGNDGKPSSSSSSSSFRSHSVDGLLDGKDGRDNQRIAEAAALVAAGSMALTKAGSVNDSTNTLRAINDTNYDSSSTNDTLLDVVDAAAVVTRREKTNAQPNTQHRKSRSLDHFLDEQSLQEIVASAESAPDGTQSLLNLTPTLTTRGGAPTTKLFDERLPASLGEANSNTPERLARSNSTSIRNNAVTRQSPEGLSSTEDDHEDAQSRSSASSSAKSQARGCSNSENINNRTRHQPQNHKTSSSSSASLGSNNPNNKTLFNRTLKKVRSLIKK